ncbi:histidine kinase [Pseudoflavitalea sp. G-6-1-2]|uniref:sensor histidine kinase n=1 Tax=Pseudoflavitalea sp. G-6-1-2 TaxID=2728841 RepID=UPI00146DD099|nr:histidine kinase [Pseudoflavitalea sp. G-6-1-2]NML23905.1 histidine kinase [Pseudoflavitalea sp. G-6-1-2]
MLSILKPLLRRVLHFLFFLLVFHVLWFIFYYLSNSGFVMKEYRFAYYKQLFVNTTGFVAFYLGAFWLFPYFISKQRYWWLAGVLLVLSVTMGQLQFRLQDWQMDNSSIFGFRKKADAPQQPGANVAQPAAIISQAEGSDVRAMFNIFVFFLFGIGYAYAKDWFVKDRRARILEKEKLQSELALLRYQLNPHFLFNTINDIYYLALIKSDTTPDALLQLSNLLRYVLNEKEEWVGLDKELEHLQQFIQLHKFRFPDEVVLQQRNIDEQISKLQIPPLLLITFVENAFKHGEPGTEETPVSIQLDLQKGQLHYQVTNHIPVNISKDSSSGIGITNLERRLSLLYPDAYRLAFTTENDRFTATLQLNLNHGKMHSN